MTIRISEETIVLVGVVIGAFILALVCLACSLNGRETLRCCKCCRRRDEDDDAEDQEPQTYATLNEFIFESENEQRPARVAVNEVLTSMEDVFPDLLAGGDTENPNRSNVNEELSEPLL